ncbi:MAG: M24 family metallopeptidase [Solirubrobacteraceae bacterium]
MTELSDRLNTPIPTAELERRWAAVRAAMADAGIDVLVMQNNSERLGGYVRWFTDLPAFDYPVTVMFPREGLMTVVSHGMPGAREIPPDGDGVFRGVERVIGTASFPSAHYTRTYDAELLAPALEPYARASIGLVGTYQLGYATGTYLAQRFPHAAFAEASELVDQIKALKSAEEQRLIRATAAMQDEVMRVALEAVQPGRRESDITAVAERAAQELGSEAGIFLSGAGPIGEPAVITQRHHQNRVIRAGDVLALLVEVDGPGGLYAELGRTCTVGPAPARIKEELELVLAAQRFTVERLVPGAACRDVFAAYNEFLREHGRPEEQRIHAHGQGYDLVERPLIRADETMQVQAEMNFACHPAYVIDGFFIWVCDNWMIGPDGPGERLHAFPQEIVELA